MMRTCLIHGALFILSNLIGQTYARGGGNAERNMKEAERKDKMDIKKKLEEEPEFLPGQEKLWAANLNNENPDILEHIAAIRENMKGHAGVTKIKDRPMDIAAKKEAGHGKARHGTRINLQTLGNQIKPISTERMGGTTKKPMDWIEEDPWTGEELTGGRIRRIHGIVMSQDPIEPLMLSEKGEGTSQDGFVHSTLHIFGNAFKCVIPLLFASFTLSAIGFQNLRGYLRPVPRLQKPLLLL